MGSSNPLKDAYYSLEDKWYGFVDALADKVPAIGSAVDSLEDKNIPTFPLAILVIIVIILLIAFFLTAGANSTLSLIVKDNTGAAVEGASVVVLSSIDSTTVADMSSGADGSVSFSLPNGEYSIKVDKDKYSAKTQSITLNGNTEEDLVLSLEDTLISKAVYLKTADGLKISGTGSVKYKCIGTNEDEQLATYSNGQFTANVKESCASVEIISLQNYDLVSTTASFSGNSAVTVKEQDVQKGKALVLLQADTNLPVGIRVQLVPSDGTLPIEKITTGTNVINFDDLAVKKYYLLVTDPTGNYVTYDGSKLGITEVKDILKDQSTTFVAVMTKAATATITVSIKDNATKLPVSGVTVKLTSVINENDVQSKMTGATGQIVFNVPQNSNYIISAEHPDYFTGETSAATSNDKVEVFIDKVDPAKSNSLLVKVTDGAKSPVENARVILKKIDASAEPVVSEKTTDTGGRAEFFNLELGKSYIANVSKEGFGSVNSTTIQIEPRKQSLLEVIFDIGTGTIRVKVLDPTKNPLSGVSVKAMNYFTAQQEASSILTNTDGIAEFNIRADRKVYFVIESTAYSKYFTSAIYPAANGTTEKEIVLVSKGAPLQAYPIEILSGSEVLAGDGNSSSAITQGTYTIKSKLQVPKGTFSEAGIHIRTGQAVNGKINLMEEDGLSISNVYSFGKVTKGTTYTPPSGYETDQKNLTTGDAKWINSVWKNPVEGTYEIEAEITVSETDPNKPLDIYYRGWAKGANVIRDPAGTPTQNELYAVAKKRPLALGASSMCSALGFCKSMSIEPLTGSDIGRKKYVSGTIQAKKDVQYLLTVDLTNFSGKTITGAELNVEGKALELNSLNVNGADQVLGSRIALSPIGVDAPMQVKIIFTPKASGASAVRLSIISGSEYKLDETVTVNVAQNKTFSLDFVPKVIVPYITNTMFFDAYTDANTSLEGALITIRADGKILGKTQTTSDGLATFELSGQEIGTTIRITAQKEGYDDVVIDTAVDKSLLRITPPSISETIKIGDVKAITEGIGILNSTAKDIKVLGAQINGDMKDYVDVKVIGMENSTIIDSGKDRNYSVSIKLKSAAYNLTAPKDLTGTIIINTEVSDAGSGFLSEIPVSIRLSMPGYLDGAKCISVEPAVADFITASTEQSKTITITNACTAEDTPIALHNLEAKLSEAAKFGTINISGTGFKSTSLSDKYVKVADVLNAGAEEEITLTFVPNPSIASGVQSFNISLIGKNFLDENVEEKVEAQIKATTTMSNLSKCIEVTKPDGGITLDILPWNTGAGMIQNSNYSPYANGIGNYGYGGSSTSATYGGFSQRTAPYNMSYMNGLNMGTYGTNGYGNGYGNTFGAGTGQGNFTIKNNCAGDVEIQMDVDSRISVGETTFTISKDSEQNVPVTAGYVLGTYKVKVNGKIVGVDTGKKKVSEVSVKVRRLGDVDTDCISTNMTELNLNSFVQRPQTYAVYNYCYDSGVQLSRSNNVATIECSAPDLYSGTSMYGGGYGSAYGGMYGAGAYGGYGSAYGGYGGYGGSVGNSYGNYYNTYGGNGITSSGCAVQSCSLVAGTRSRNRTVEYETTRAVEKVEFDIMPSAQYNPQAKLFDNRRGSYGLFQNIGSLRNWMTQTDARMNVYGNLNVSYSNQYGSNQCMTFPLTISNIWGLTESIDSAINWGDPNAKPADCQNRNALDIYSYWKARDPANGGAVPEDRYVNGVYLYQAEPAALRIGAAPSTVSPYYPSYDNYYFVNKANETKKTDLGSAKASCGLLDSITVLTKINPEQTGGAIITVTTMTSGSLINNTQGANLWVEVNRANMTSECLLIQGLPVEGKVSRTINFESAQLSWPLTVLITQPGFKWIDTTGSATAKETEAKARCKTVSVGDILDCQTKFKALANSEGITADKLTKDKFDAIMKKLPGCESTISGVERGKELLTAAIVATNDCDSKAKEYGFDKIKTTTIDGLIKSGNDVDTYCLNNFCSSQQLQVFLLNKVNKINVLANAVTGAPGVQLAKLYTAAGTTTVKMCNKDDLNLFNAENGLVLEAGTYNIPDSAFTTPTDEKKVIIAQGDDALAVMSSAFDKLKKADDINFNKLLLEVDYNKQYGGVFTVELGMTKVGQKYYMSLDRYNELLKKVSENIVECSVNGVSCTISKWCGTTSMSIKPEWIEWMSSHARLRKGVYDRSDISLSDQEMVYRQNPKLNEIHKLGTFSFARGKYNIDVNKTVYLTQVSAFTPLTQGFMETVVKGAKEYPLTFNLSTTEIGRYDTELDFVLGPTTGTISVNLSNKNIENIKAKTMDNVLLNIDFAPLEVSFGAELSSPTHGSIVEKYETGTFFYKRVPVVFSAALLPYESKLVYNTSSEKFNSIKPPLIKWYTTNNSLYADDGIVIGGFGVPVAMQSTELKLKGVYYYPQDGGLVFLQNVKGATISAKVGTKIVPSSVLISSKTIGPNSAGAAMQLTDYQPSSMVLDDVLKEVGTNACPNDKGDLVWNEAGIIKAN